MHPTLTQRGGENVGCVGRAAGGSSPERRPEAGIRAKSPGISCHKRKSNPTKFRGSFSAIGQYGTAESRLGP